MKANLTSAILVVFITLSTLTAAAEVPMPATRAGEIATAYVASFNSADPDQIRAFETKYRCAAALTKRPVDERVPRVVGLIQQIGRLELAEIKYSDEHHLEVVAKSHGTGMWLLMTFELEKTEPYKLNSISMAPSSPPTDEAITADWTNLAELAALAVENYAVPGIAVAVADDQQILDVGVAGTRTLGGEKIEKDDTFHIGSVTKAITATMIARLVELDQIAWDDKLGDNIPIEGMNEAYAGVTLLELLTHRAGIPAYTNFSDEEEMRLAKLPGTASQQRLVFCTEVLQEEPVGPRGEFEYSNAGYSLAAIMAETRTGQTWEALIEQHIFDAADLHRAGFGWPALAASGQQPLGYSVAGDEFVPQILQEPGIGAYLAPAGDVRLSVADLVAFGQIHLRGLRGKDTLLTSGSCKKLHAPAPGNLRYACGWFIEDDFSWHAGSAGSFYAVLRVYPKLNRVVAVLTNVGPAKGDAPTRWMADAIVESVAD